MRLYLIAVTVMLLSTPIAAEQANDPKLDPGLIQAGSPIYFLDSATERFTGMTGLRSQGDIAHEKASEIAVAKQRNQTEAAERAGKRLSEVSMAATNRSYTGLRKAEQVLQQVQNQTPEEADEGMSTALEAVQKAQTRQPVRDGLFEGIPDLGAGNRTPGGQDAPDSDHPDQPSSSDRGR